MEGSEWNRDPNIHTINMPAHLFPEDIRGEDDVGYKHDASKSREERLSGES